MWPPEMAATIVCNLSNPERIVIFQDEMMIVLNGDFSFERKGYKYVFHENNLGAETESVRIYWSYLGARK